MPNEVGDMSNMHQAGDTGPLQHCARMPARFAGISDCTGYRYAANEHKIGALARCLLNAKDLGGLGISGENA
jgi:hypothetical protein